MERLVDALKLSRASGIPIEKLAGEAFDKFEIRFKRRHEPLQGAIEELVSAGKEASMNEGELQ